MRIRRTIVAAFLLALLVEFVPSASSAIDLRWDSPFPGTVTGVAVDRHGATYAVGERRVRVGGRRLIRIVIARYGSGGGLTWLRTWGPPRNAVMQPVVDVAPDGTVVVGATIIGRRSSFCSGWILRAYAPDGRMRWHREQQGARGCAGYDQVSAVSANAGLIVLTGNAISDGLGAEHGWVRGFDAAGTMRWGHRLRYTGGPADGYDAARDVAVSSLGRVYVVGSVSRRRADGYFGSFRRLIVKLTPDGGLIWSRILPDSEPRREDGDRLDAVSLVGRWLVVGGAVTRRGDPRMWVARLGFDGAVRRERVVGSAGRRNVDVGVLSNGVTYAVRTSGTGTSLLRLGPRLRLRSVWELPGFSSQGATLAVGGGGVVTTSDPPDVAGDTVWRFSA